MTYDPQQLVFELYYLCICLLIRRFIAAILLTAFDTLMIWDLSLKIIMINLEISGGLPEHIQGLGAHPIVRRAVKYRRGVSGGRSVLRHRVRRHTSISGGRD